MCIGPFAPKIPKAPALPPTPDVFAAQNKRKAEEAKQRLRQVRAKGSGVRSTLGPRGFLGIPQDNNN